MSMWTTWLPIVLSCISLAVSIVVFVLTGKQFFLLNQGYLDVEPQLGVAIPDNQKVMTGRFNDVPSDLHINGINPALIVKNVGNIPIHYNVKRFSVTLNGKEYSNVRDTDLTYGVLYPKQQANFELATVYLDSLDHNKTFTYQLLRQTDMRCHFIVEYSNLNERMGKRKWDRAFVWKLYDNILKYVWMEYKDTI